ncbi:hypothetical protein DOY81_009583 [Sarcophaga bullata]|nr:hypothetical protein DOY81_009583 [Sarcophaga bullata]
MSLKADWFYTHPTLPTPMSETHETLLLGSKVIGTRKRKSKRRNDFFPRGKRAVKADTRMDEFKQSIAEKGYSTSSYKRDFDAPYPAKCPPKLPIDDNVDPLFNRRPVNDFYTLPWAPGKFMDDHISKPSEARMRINFFRQIREKSYFDSILEQEDQRKVKIKENKSGE